MAKKAVFLLERSKCVFREWTMRGPVLYFFLRVSRFGDPYVHEVGGLQLLLRWFRQDCLRA